MNRNLRHARINLEHEAAHLARIRRWEHDDDDNEMLMHLRRDRDDEMEILMNFEDFDDFIAVRRGHQMGNRPNLL